MTESIEASAESKTLRERINFPHGESYIDAVKKSFKGQPEKAEIAAEVVYAFLEEEVGNIDIFRVETPNAAFPYTVISVGDLAKRLYDKGEGSLPALQERPKAEAGRRQEFVFGSFLTIGNGFTFTFVEEVMHQTFKSLPRALKDIVASREPEDIEIYTLGSPTNALGEVSEDFAKASEGDVYGTFAHAYTQFIKTRLPEGEEASRSSICLYGLSMGGSFAAATGARLLEEGLVRQKEDISSKLPFMQIRADSPVGLRSPKFGGMQIMAGFGLDGIFKAITSPTVRRAVFGEKDFLNKVFQEIEERGITSKMSSEQVELKKRVLKLLKDQLYKGTPVVSDLKVTEVVGSKDLTLLSPALNKQAKRDKNTSIQTLGASLVRSVSTENERVFLVNMTHTPPFYRDNEIRRVARVIETIEDLNAN